jgi:hypothetical protein
VLCTNIQPPNFIHKLNNEAKVSSDFFALQHNWWNKPRRCRNAAGVSAKGEAVAIFMQRWGIRAPTRHQDAPPGRSHGGVFRRSVFLNFFLAHRGPQRYFDNYIQGAARFADHATLTPACAIALSLQRVERDIQISWEMSPHLHRVARLFF